MPIKLNLITMQNQMSLFVIKKDVFTYNAQEFKPEHNVHKTYDMQTQ